jgi:dTMP kinase
MTVQAGKFISLEGIEGAGKSTLAQTLALALRARGLTVELTREPGGTPLAERLRSLLLERGDERIDGHAETLMMFAARAIHLTNRVRPALLRGHWVICDRFTDATRAYQGGGRGVSAQLIEQLAGAVHADLWPHRTLLLDLPVALGVERARARRAHPDRIEQEASAFFERARAIYQRIALAEPQRVRVLDATAGAEQVLAQALQALADLLPAPGAESDLGSAHGSP